MNTKTDRRKTTSTVHFTVDPDGITRLIRDMWREGSFDKAFNVLSSMSAGEPIPIDKQYGIVRGNLKFSRFQGDPDQFCIVSDNWKPRDTDYYPDPEPAKLAAYLEKRADQKAKREWYRSLRGEQRQDEPNTDEPTVRFEGEVVKPMKMFAGYGSVEEMNMAFAFQKSVPTVDETVAAMRSRDERDGKVRPDTTLVSEMGWVLPNGKFYPCLTKMEHIWLAGQFNLTETQAEQKGWVKITRDFLGERFIHQGKISATQKQINTVFDWCEKHKAKLPDWAGGKI